MIGRAPQNGVLVNEEYGLRFHTVPRVGSTSIRNAIRNQDGPQYYQTTTHRAGPELRAMFVRNPIDRLASQWKYYKRQETNWDHMGLRKDMVFSQFVHRALLYIWADAHLTPQAIYLGPYEIDVMIPFEYANEGWKSLKDKLGFPYELPHDNKSTCYEPDQLTKETMREVELCYSSDFILYQRAKKAWET